MKAAQMGIKPKPKKSNLAELLAMFPGGTMKAKLNG